jgi:hypothetical protein
VQSNDAKLTIAGNAAKGNIAVQSNAGSSASTLSGNSAGGNCVLQGDNPKIKGSGNTAAGSNSCNATA